jgi:hypothetical protein
MGVGENLMNDMDGQSAKPGASVLIVREKQHHLNLSGGKELLIPSRLLYGLVPEALLEAYTFYQDESLCPADTLPDNFVNASRGYKRLRGYPKESDTAAAGLIIFVEIRDTPWKWNDFSASQHAATTTNNEGLVQITKFPGRTVKIFSRPKDVVEETFRSHKRIASAIEACGLLMEPVDKKKKADEEAGGSETAAGKDEMLFKIDAAVECDYEGKADFWPCIVRRVNDNNTYDLEYVNDYKWVGIQRGVDPALVQNVRNEIHNDSFILFIIDFS